MISFNKSNFTTNYSFSSPRSIIRALSDSFSKQFCDTKGAIKYAAKATKGRCLYCGQPLYKINDDVPVFSNLVNYDHIYPASKLNLFEVGNVALSCETCNLAKSNRMPMEYYDIRTTENSSLFIYDREEFERFLDEMTKPYKEKWYKHYEVCLLDLTDDEFKCKLDELLFQKIDISSASIRYNHENSVNWPTWEAVVKKAYETYTPSTAKDVEGRIGYANEIFEETIGHSTLIEDCKLTEINKYINVLLLSKYDSKNEIQKYRMLIKMLIEVLNEDLMEGQLDSFFETVPTYSRISKN